MAIEPEINTAIKILGLVTYERFVLEGALRDAAEENLRLQSQLDAAKETGETEKTSQPEEA